MDKVNKDNTMFNLIGKTIIITGATGYLGKAICNGFAKQGANIAVCSRSQANADDLALELNDTFGIKVMGYQLDLQEIGKIADVIGKIIEDFGGIHCLINNAYFGDNCSIKDVTLKSWEKGLDGSITSVVFMVEECVKYLEETQGNIINIASMYGIVSPDPSIYINQAPNPMSYGVGKAAIIHYTKYAAVHLADKNIRVNAVSPGPFPNKQIQKNKPFIQKLCEKVPLNRIGQPHDIIGALVFLASNEASYITGHNLIVDGGWTVM